MTKPELEPEVLLILDGMHGGDLTMLWASMDTTLGERLRPRSVRFTTTRSSE